ncbi:Uncharacterized protein Fot_11240 [Forsythia ovata]|uniref:Uncharacterized protein n=1 Tax=Forsythia ovata TaxID=205694 RepID=A0ABD1WMW1_9LAMI
MAGGGGLQRMARMLKKSGIIETVDEVTKGESKVCRKQSTARTKTTTHHPEVRRSHRGATTATSATIPPATTPLQAPVFLPPPSATPRLLPPHVPPVSGTILSSSVPQPTAAASEGPSTAAISTRVTSQWEFDEDTSSDHGTGSQSSKTVSVTLSRAQKGKQKVDERSNIDDLPAEHHNIRQHASDVPISVTHP